MDPVIEFNGISIEYKMKDVSIRAVDKVTLPIQRGKVTAIVGESGSGKTTLVSSVLRNISSPGEVVEGEVIFRGAEKDAVKVLALDKAGLAAYRWRSVSMVFQGVAEHAQSVDENRRTVLRDGLLSRRAQTV